MCRSGARAFKALALHMHKQSSRQSTMSRTQHSRPSADQNRQCARNTKLTDLMLPLRLLHRPLYMYTTASHLAHSIGIIHYASFPMYADSTDV